MQKAQQLDDQSLVKLISKKLILLNKTGAKFTTRKGTLIPFPTIHASAEIFNQEPHMFDHPAFNFNRGRGNMKKNPFAIYCIAAIVLFILSVVLVHFYNPDDTAFMRMTPIQPAMVVSSIEYNHQYAPELNLIAGACVFLLVGHLFWAIYRKFKKDIQINSNASERLFYEISLETGWTEYELFHISAEGWSVSEDRIDEDFKRYMSDQVLPYYVIEFVRKNYEYIDESLIKNEEFKPTSSWDFVKALLVFPGILFLLVIPGFFGYTLC
jgi:hypothetical protein